MNSSIISNSVRFVCLVLLQVLVFNNINFLGYINPYPYVLFLILYPFNGNQALFLFLSFALGLSIDIFEDSGGMNAAACLVVAYVRPYLLGFSFGVSYDYQTVKFSSTPFGSRFSYVLLVVLIHHFVLFFLEIFNFAHLLLVLKRTLFSALFSILLIFISLALFNRKRK